jgi:hypothetical protein
MSHVERVVALSAEDARVVHDSLMRFNSSVVPFTQSEPFFRMQHGIHDSGGTLIAGITATLYCWGILSTTAIS